MKAVLVTEFGGAEVLKYTEVELPEVKSNEVLIKVDATSVNYADIKARFGQKGANTPPFIPGLDATGTIQQVGSNVKGLKVGQRVISFPHGGTYAEYVVASELLTYEIPESISLEVAAASPIVSFLSYTLLADLARMKKGETVVVHSAAGGVGSTAVQFAKLLGAGTVIGTVGNLAKANIALEAGADYVLSYEEGDFAKEINEITSGNGADIILDSVAGSVTGKSLECLTPYGRLINFGNSSGGVGQFTTSDVHASCRSVLGFSLGTTRKKRPQLIGAIAEKVIPLLADGRINIKIGKHFPLEEAAQAQSWIESRQSIGKVLLKVT
ncbi:quinone oxidoreductase family protein [Bacillus pinisoli]|uniref:quinone oxidoreductase family protein n=1 Tax=Bacillus pinisoli TaxID=2901866 RepID=UPI001FF4307C|nr:zinc-binding dehydrogenase [Bacillus pinisoli]